MGMYKYACNKCGEVKKEDNGFICKCGGEFKLDGGIGSFDPFVPYWAEHLDTHPILITSRSHRKALLKHYGVEIKPYKKLAYSSYRPIGKDGHKMSEHEYQKALKANFWETPQDIRNHRKAV